MLPNLSFSPQSAMLAVLVVFDRLGAAAPLATFRSSAHLLDVTVSLSNAPSDCCWQHDTETEPTASLLLIFNYKKGVYSTLCSSEFTLSNVGYVKHAVRVFLILKNQDILVNK